MSPHPTPARLRRTCAVAVACAFAGALACSGAEETPAAGEAREAVPARAVRDTNVYVISLDSASARYLEPYGASPGSTPHIAAFAEDAVVFDAAYSQTATTVSSVASLLTGVRNTTHLVEARTMSPMELPTLVEMLREHGYRGFGFVANPMAGLPRLGFHRGYEVYLQVYAHTRGALAENPSFSGTPYKLVYPEDITRELEQVLVAFGKTKTFAYFHYLQPHTPYDPPAAFRRDFEEDGGAELDWDALHERYQEANETGEASPETIALLEARYRANLKYADAGVGEIFAKLREAGLYDDALIVLTADHGEAFFGHGQFGHNWTLYDDMTRVPLIVRFPASDDVAPRRIPAPTETIDLLPTILDYLGLPVPPQAEGSSLWPLVTEERERLDEPEVVISTSWRELHAIRHGPFKLIVDADGHAELYDLERDPGEQRDLSHERPEVVEALGRELTAKIDLASGRSIRSAQAPEIEPELRDLLETLGYGYVGADPEPR